MQKSDAVASLGQTKLLRPARIKAALAANDRLKFALSALQAAAAHAGNPSAPPLDLRREYTAAGLEAPWMLELSGASWIEGGALHLPDQPRRASPSSSATTSGRWPARSRAAPIRTAPVSSPALSAGAAGSTRRGPAALTRPGWRR